MKKWNDKSKKRMLIIIVAIALFFILVVGNVLRKNTAGSDFDPNQTTEIDNTDKAVEEREKPVLEQSKDKEAYNKDTKTHELEAKHLSVTLAEDMKLVYDDIQDGIHTSSFSDEDQENMFDFIILEDKDQLEQVVENMIENGEEVFDKIDVKDVKYLGQDAKRINLALDEQGDVLRFLALELDGKSVIISLESYVGSLDFLEKMVNDTLKLK